ncbi:MAG: BBE domain-containing protein, partial [Acidobacteriia bacterium]|nr:BBE domain-containing protein [Terriglobia bacterium]
MVCQWTDPADSQLQIARTRALWGKVEPHTTGAAMINHIGAEDQPDRIRASYAGNYERLAAIKHKYDPTNFFCFNANIRPADLRAAVVE